MSPVKRWGSPCLFPLQLFSLCWVLSVAQSKTVRYSTFEEDAPGTVIGTLAEDLHMKVSGDTSFRLMKQFNSSLLRVREGDGQLTVGDTGLDRERLCGQAPQCVLAFDVVSFSQEQFRLVHVEVEVRDVNDHAPRFPRAQIPVEVSESAPVGTRIPLEVPVDEDVGANGLQSVRLAEPHSPFRVELQTRADGAQCADLVLLQELDRESQASYSLELVAQDGGRPPRSATAALNVRVLDANDHSPAFPQGAVAEVELAEDAPVGSLLLDLDAADPDEGPNGDVVFTFGARTPPEARHLFRLDPRSGRLTLAGQVDYERQDTYELDVRAQDRGPGPRAATCKVIVRIRDVNDNAPDISITPLAAPGAPAASPFAAAAAAAALGPPPAVAAAEVPGSEGGSATGESACHFEGQQRLRGAHAEPYGASPGFGKEPAPPVAVWKGHSFNTISGREAEKFSGKDSGKGDSDFNDSDSDISGDALKKDLINHMQSGLWACTAECKILGHSDRCWSPSCAGPNAHPPPHPPAQMSTFCKSTSLPRDPLRRDNYYQAQLPKTVGLQSVYEKVLHRDYDRTVTLLSPPRPGRLPDLQEIGVPLYESPPGGRYVSPKKGANENV
uniref:protocadherin-8 n=1 Tax=Myodes glareolus TaxID=447135 RepID=UPI00202050B6|nr:protocadherin-8 [Myodes glareolus]